MAGIRNPVEYANAIEDQSDRGDTPEDFEPRYQQCPIYVVRLLKSES